jgi:hypothetical protein
LYREAHGTDRKNGFAGQRGFLYGMSEVKPGIGVTTIYSGCLIGNDRLKQVANASIYYYD